MWAPGSMPALREVAIQMRRHKLGCAGRNVKLRDTNLVVKAAVERSIEVRAAQHGAHTQLFVASHSGTLTSAGIACPTQRPPMGAVLHRARQDKGAKYWDWKVAGVTSLSWPWRREGDGATKRSPSLTASRDLLRPQVCHAHLVTS